MTFVWHFIRIFTLSNQEIMIKEPPELLDHFFAAICHANHKKNTFIKAGKNSS